MDFFLRRLSRLSFSNVRLDARQGRHSRARAAGKFVAPIASPRARNDSHCAGMKRILPAFERGFSAANFLNLATLLLEFNRGLNPPILESRTPYSAENHSRNV